MLRLRAAEIIEGIYDLVLETVLCQKPSIWISKNEYPTNLVKSKFLKLNNMHLEYVMGCMKENTTKVRNIENHIKESPASVRARLGKMYNEAVKKGVVKGVERAVVMKNGVEQLKFLCRAAVYSNKLSKASSKK